MTETRKEIIKFLENDVKWINILKKWYQENETKILE